LAGLVSEIALLTPASFPIALDVDTAVRPFTLPDFTDAADFIAEGFTLCPVAAAGIPGFIAPEVLVSTVPGETTGAIPLAAVCVGFIVACDGVTLCFEVTEAFPEGFPT
jgi:hypothetical protein